MLKNGFRKLDFLLQKPKLIQRRILATAPPTDVLHRATLINTALVTICNHAFMVLPVWVPAYGVTAV